MFSCEFREISKNNFSFRTPMMNGSAVPGQYCLSIPPEDFEREHWLEIG